ncbi:MAG: TraB/GumN family protein [bacterium]
MKFLKALKNLFKIALIAFAFIASKYLARFLGWLKSGTVIYREKHLCTPVVHLVHPKTKRRIILMGMMHVGDPEYFQELQHVLNTLKEYRVLYEGIGTINAEQKLLFSEKEQEIFNAMEKSMSDRNIMSAFLRLQGQRDGLNYEASWIRTDMSQFDLIRAMAAKGLGWTKAPKFPGVNEKIESLIVTWLLNALLIRMQVLFLFLKLFHFGKEEKAALQDIIITERNKIAVDGILEHVQHDHVVSIWGAAHLPGMISLLNKQGYREQERTWFKAYRDRNEYGKQILDEIIAQSKTREKAKQKN